MNVFKALRIPDLFSLLNAFFGLLAILAAGAGSPYVPVIFVFLSAAADGLDGLVARRFGSGVLGANLDSLADLISFGVAPAVLFLGIFGGPWPAVLVALAYLTCGILRLARFNVSKSSSYFEGLPITAAGIAAAASVLADRQIFTLLLMLVLAAFMASSVPFPKIRDPRVIGAFAVVLAASTSLVMLQRDAGCALMLLAITTYLSSPVVVPYLRRKR